MFKLQTVQRSSYRRLLVFVACFCLLQFSVVPEVEARKEGKISRHLFSDTLISSSVSETGAVRKLLRGGDYGGVSRLTLLSYSNLLVPYCLLTLLFSFFF